MSAPESRLASEGANDDGEVPYELEAQIGFVLRRAHQRASDVFAREMAPFDVTPVQFSTMVRLAQHGEMTRGRLRRLVAMDPATAVGVVRRLRERGWVEQRTDPADARRLLIVLTAGGHERVNAMMRHAVAVSHATLSPLSAQEQTQLLELLGRVAAAR